MLFTQFFAAAALALPLAAAQSSCTTECTPQFATAYSNCQSGQNASCATLCDTSSSGMYSAAVACLKCQGNGSTTAATDFEAKCKAGSSGSSGKSAAGRAVPAGVVVVAAALGVALL